MPNIFLLDPVYITIAQIDDTTSKAWLIALTDDEKKVLITKAQNIIDWYIWSYWTKFDEDQANIFPIEDEDWASELPLDITTATFYTVEQLFESWDLISWAVSSSNWWAVTQEKTWDRTVSYSSDATSTTNNALKFLWIPPEAENILKKYKNIFFKNVL